MQDYENELLVDDNMGQTPTSGVEEKVPNRSRMILEIIEDLDTTGENLQRGMMQNIISSSIITPLQVLYPFDIFGHVPGQAKPTKH